MFLLKTIGLSLYDLQNVNELELPNIQLSWTKSERMSANF